MDFEFSDDQKVAIDAIFEWYKNGHDTPFVLGGAAGVGKSTVIAHLKDLLPFKKIKIVAFTGKAALVLQRKLNSIGVDVRGVSTIHSLMYKAILDSEQNIIGWDKKDKIDCDLVVVDEASMVPYEIYLDLLSYNIPILFVGDHHQLPPVGLTDFNLMEKCDIKLETPHRFASDSTIVKVATMIRNGETLKYGIHGKGVVKRRSKNVTALEKRLFFQSNEVKSGDCISLCGFNKTRVNLNNMIREYIGKKSLIDTYERVICLKNSKDKNMPLYNGSLGTVVHVKRRFKETTKIYLNVDGMYGNLYISAFNDLFGEAKPNTEKRSEKQGMCFDYGYAISCHKSQGSSWKRVCVFEEECDLWDNRRWLYTAVTRAEKELLIIKR